MPVESKASGVRLQLVHLIRVLAPLLVALALDARAAAPAPAPGPGQEIQYLIASVEDLQGAHFIRNGTSYEAANAASHLRLKLQRAGSRVRTAEDFIRLCASVSSVSGEPYGIRFADGRTVTSESFFREKLAEFRKRHGPGG